MRKRLEKMIKHLNIRIIKFLIAGGTAAIVEYGLFFFIETITGGKLVVLSNTASFIGGLITSFLLNKFWVFKSTGSVQREFTTYLILAIINLTLSTLSLLVFVKLINVPVLIAKIIVMIMIAIWNYLLFSKVIFKQLPSIHDKV